MDSPTPSFSLLALTFAAGLFCGLLLLFTAYIRLARSHSAAIKAARTQSIRQSAATVRGQIAEQMAPMLPGFNYDPADCTFVGEPIDYVIFDGLAAARRGEGDGIVTIVLLDVKTGKSRLSQAQRLVKDAVETGNIQFKTARVNSDYSVSVT